jgi:hypothetical protein
MQVSREKVREGKRRRRICRSAEHRKVSTPEAIVSTDFSDKMTKINV